MAKRRLDDIISGEGTTINSGNLQDNVRTKNDYQNLLAKERTPKIIRVHDYRDKDKIILVPIGDEHIGSRYHAAKELREHIDWCLENKTPVIMMGDTLETATKDSVGAGVFEQDQIVDEQLQIAEALYSPLAQQKLLLGLLRGNHELRTFNSSGIDLSRILSRNLDVPYLGVGAIHRFLVGKESYMIYTTHGSSGARLPYTKIKSVIDLDNMVEGMDVYVMGHLHQLSHHIKNIYVPDIKNKTIKERNIHYVLSGCYLSHWGSYAHIKNMEPSRIGSPKIKLHGDEHLVRVSL